MFVTMPDFRDMEVYKKAKRFQSACRDILNEKKLDPYMIDQLGRASLSVVLNLSEGFSRFSSKGQKMFFVISRGSIFECLATLEILKETGRISTSEYQTVAAPAEELSKMLFTMIKNLER